MTSSIAPALPMLGVSQSRMLREVATIRGNQKIDWAGNITFAIGTTFLLLAITYGIEPYGNSPTGWSNPFVIGGRCAPNQWQRR